MLSRIKRNRFSVRIEENDWWDCEERRQGYKTTQSQRTAGNFEQQLYKLTYLLCTCTCRSCKAAKCILLNLTTMKTHSANNTYIIKYDGEESQNENAFLIDFHYFQILLFYSHIFKNTSCR